MKNLQWGNLLPSMPFSDCCGSKLLTNCLKRCLQQKTSFLSVLVQINRLLVSSMRTKQNFEKKRKKPDFFGSFYSPFFFVLIRLFSSRCWPFTDFVYVLKFFFGKTERNNKFCFAGVAQIHFYFTFCHFFLSQCKPSSSYSNEAPHTSRNASQDWLRKR